MSGRGSPRGLPAGFARFWAGEAVSGFGAAMSLLALQTIVVLDLDGGTRETGWLTSARWLPYLVLGLFAGALVDRVRRRPVMIGTDLARAALLGLVPLAWATGHLTLPALLVIVVGFGAVSLLNDAASQSFVPRLVPRESLQRGHAWLDGADAVAESGGPAAAGALARLIGAPLVLLVGCATYVISAIAVLTLRVTEPDVERPERRSLRREIGEGVRWVYGRSGLARLALATHTWFIGQAVLVVVLPVYALTHLDLGVVVFGVTTAAAGVGALLGAALSSRVGGRVGTVGAIITAHLLSTVGTVVMVGAGAAAAGFALGAGQMVHGMAMGLSNSHEMTYRQALTPDRLQGRTNTTMRAVNRTMLVLVAPVAGLLAAVWGMRPMLLVAAGVFALAALALLPIRGRRI